jgi:hypothetical protein
MLVSARSSSTGVDIPRSRTLHGWGTRLASGRETRWWWTPSDSIPKTAQSHMSKCATWPSPEMSGRQSRLRSPSKYWKFSRQSRQRAPDRIRPKSNDALRAFADAQLTEKAGDPIAELRRATQLINGVAAQIKKRRRSTRPVKFQDDFRTVCGLNARQCPGYTKNLTKLCQMASVLAFRYAQTTQNTRGDVRGVASHADGRRHFPEGLRVPVDRSAKCRKLVSQIRGSVRPAVDEFLDGVFLKVQHSA